MEGRPASARRSASPANVNGATPVVGKLDRLARKVVFMLRQMKSGVEFMARNFPQVNRLSVHILPAFAKHERELVSGRSTVGIRRSLTCSPMSGLRRPYRF